jgi:hypothetical protein
MEAFLPREMNSKSSSRDDNERQQFESKMNALTRTTQGHFAQEIEKEHAGESGLGRDRSMRKPQAAR